MISTETIVALSSAPAMAARAIVRLSGSLAVAIASDITNLLPAPCTARGCLFHLDSWEFPGTIYFFRSPRSYTGEDLVEFHLPGNSLICRRVIQSCLQRGARLAEPGEFTARAFFNSKMDLTQAEGVAATISALNQRQLAAARQLLAGELARRLAPITELIADTLALVEAGIDFVDEAVSFISQELLAGRLSEAKRLLGDLVEQSDRFGTIGTEPTAVLVGRPNAGKSTLLNALAQSERAIVSAVAGTTRDALSADVALAHGIIKLFDVAGLDESACTNDIEQQMQAHARRAVESADLVIYVIESSDALSSIDIGRPADIRVRTKIDLSGKILPGEIGISAISGAGMDHLRQTMDRLAFGNPGIDATVTLNARHLHAISETLDALDRAQTDLVAPHECVALHLREALDHLGQITGTISPDELLGKIFGKFCIGK